MTWLIKMGNNYFELKFKYKYQVNCECLNREKDGEKIPLNSSNLLLRGCMIKNTDFIEGLVLYAGMFLLILVSRH